MFVEGENMYLTFTDEAKERVSKYLTPNKKMILDYDDGVGPFSAVGDCSLDVGYKLVFVNKDKNFPDFNAKMESNLGDIYYKDYTKSQFAEKMELRFNSRYFTMPLVSAFGTLIDNVEILDLGDEDPDKAEMNTTHDC